MVVSSHLRPLRTSPLAGAARAPRTRPCRTQAWTSDESRATSGLRPEILGSHPKYDIRTYSEGDHTQSFVISHSDDRFLTSLFVRSEEHIVVRFRDRHQLLSASLPPRSLRPVQYGF